LTSTCHISDRQTYLIYYTATAKKVWGRGRKSVEEHFRATQHKNYSSWYTVKCYRLITLVVPPSIIDKGILHSSRKLSTHH